MKEGKHICETLKAIRCDIAAANEIDYTPHECTHEGDCAGTCPACEQETRWLERQLRNRQALGKVVTIAGLTVALSAMSSCHKIFHVDGMIMSPPESGNDINAPAKTTNGNNTKPSAQFTPVDSTESPIQLMGDVVNLPDSTDTKQPKKTTKK